VNERTATEQDDQVDAEQLIRKTTRVGTDVAHNRLKISGEKVVVKTTRLARLVESRLVGTCEEKSVEEEGEGRRGWEIRRCGEEHKMVAEDQRGGVGVDRG
jgi:hypothetical protein